MKQESARAMRLAAAVVVLAGPALAAPMGVPHGADLAGPAERVVFVQRSVPVGGVRVSDPYKCIRKVGGTVYFSTGRSEDTARAKLAQVAPGTAFCYLRNQSLLGL